MNERNELSLTVRDHEIAFTEVSFLLQVLTEALGDVVGRSSPTLGVTAGRHMARKLPIFLESPDLASVMTAISERMQSGWEMAINVNDASAEVGFARCAIREVCERRGLELGGELCKMFHYYLGGMTAELIGKPVRASIIEAGKTCKTRMQV